MTQRNDVIAQVVGGAKRVIEGASTVSDVRRQMGLANNFKAAVNGEPRDDGFQVRGGDYVSFQEAVKGA